MLLIDFLKKIKLLKVRYIIGVDSNYSENVFAYCLIRHCEDDKSTDIILSKTMNDKNSFQSEVSNLVKYFDAELIEEES